MKLSFLRQWHRVVLGFVMVIGWAPPAWAAYEAEMAAFAAQDLANPPPANVIVFTGSSSIVGWSGLAAAFPGYPVLNRGLTASASVTTGLRLSGTRTLNTPPKNAQAASAPAMTAARVWE